MTQELKDIFSGKKVPKITIVDYSTPEKQKELRERLKKMKEIENRGHMSYERYHYGWPSIRPKI